MKSKMLFLSPAVVAVALVLTVKTHAQLRGETVVFLVAIGTPITSGGDELVFAQPQGSMKVTGCTSDSDNYPVQNAVANPGGGRVTRFSGLITISQTSPVPDGTRVTNLFSAGQCTLTATGVVYDKYSGTVE